MPDERLLPMKVVFPARDDFGRRKRSGGPPKVFGQVDDQLRARLANEALEVKRYYAASFQRFPDMPVVAKVTLHPDAAAKSHRPDELFNEDTCPVLGVSHLGHLFVSATARGLDDLAGRMRSRQTQKTVAHLSSVQHIEPWTPEDTLDGHSPEEVTGKAQERRRPAIRCHLFHHPSTRANEAVRAAFAETVTSLDKGNTTELRYSSRSAVFAIENPSTEVVQAVSSFAGVRNLSAFPNYRIVRHAARTLGAVTAEVFPPPVANQEYALLGMIDSGTDPRNAHLQAWVQDRYDFVPRNMQLNDHGSFVAGLIVNGRSLNHGDDRFPAASSRIIDVAALDRDGLIDEFDLITVIDDTIARYPDVRVWNLSLGASDPCDEHLFSDLAVALDQRTRDHGVLFVVAAGNYEATPQRPWPAPVHLQDDRISSPGDSVRSVTVGSIAHLDSASTCVRREEPSPFSRRGPGPAHSMKPELTQYGGNCDANGNRAQTGIISINEAGQLAEHVGTSFSTPLVATVAAGVWRELDAVPDGANPLLVKALLVHSAFLRRVPSDTRSTYYHGMGVPDDVPSVISCTQSAATIIMQVPVPYGPHFEKRPFPMPSCLNRERGLRGEVFMTLLHDPPLDPNFGIEYCRSRVTASLGTMSVNTDTGEETYSSQVHQVPRGETEGYEADLVKKGYKWSPIKLYHRTFQRGPTDREWRLRVERYDRAEYNDPDGQDAVLVVTIRDPDGEAAVYNEVVRTMAQLGWAAQDLQIHSRARLQG